MKYIILVLWTFSLFLLMFSSFPFRVECRPTRAMGPGPPYLPGTGAIMPHQYLSSSAALAGKASSRHGPSNCPVMEGPSASTKTNPWPDLYVTDITMKVWDSLLVLEGTARSRSEVRSDGTFGVTFDLIRVVKGDAPLLRRRKQFRLQFLDNPTVPSQTGNGSIPTETGKSTGAGASRPSSSTALVSLSSRGTLSSTRSTVGQQQSNFNRALGVRSSSNSNQRISSQQGSSSSGARVSSSGAISLKSTNLHSNYVSSHHSQQQQVLTRRGYTPALGSSSSGGSISNRIRNNSPLPETVQSNQRYRNYHSSSDNNNSNNFTIASASRSKSLRIARSHHLQQQQFRGGHTSNYDSSRHARHGRVVVNQHNNIIVSSASSSGGGGAATAGKCLPPRATVKTGRKYFVFAAKVENHFVAVFSPELANKRNTKAVESILCKGCGQAPLVVAQKEAVLQPKDRLRIRCRLRAGNPIPVLTWYKDDKLVNITDPRFRLRSKRRQSVLVIRKAKESDTGVYKCEARNFYGSNHATTRVSLQQQPKPVISPSPKPVGTTPTTLWPVPSSKCPYDSYCLNGGTCSYYEQIGEYVCQCAEGYKGQRCDTKDIPNSGSYLSYLCIFGTNNPDYPC